MTAQKLTVEFRQNNKAAQKDGIRRTYEEQSIFTKKIEKAVMEINMYYDKYPTGRYIDKKYLVVKGIVGNDEIDAFISRLVGLGLIEYSRNNNYDQLAITRLPKCMAYFEKKNDAASQVAFAKRTSIISIIISGLSFIVVFLNFVLQNFVTK